MRKRVFLAGGLILLVGVLVMAGVLFTGKIAGNGQADGSAIPEGTFESPTQETVCGAEGDSRLLFCSLPGCSAPCWQGIRPGATTLNQVNDWAETYGNEIEGWECRDDADFPSVIECSGSDITLGIAVDVFIHVDSVWSVSLKPGYIVRDPEEIKKAMATAWADDGMLSGYGSGDHIALFELTLADALAFLGNPDEYSAMVLEGRHGELLSLIGLYYEEGIALQTSLEDHTSLRRGLPPTCKIEIESDLPVTRAYFYDTSMGVPYSSVLAPAPKEPWQGFGEVDATLCQ